MPVIRIYQDHLHKHKKGGVNLGSPRKNNPIIRCTYKKLFYALNWAPVSTSQYIYSTHLINYTKNSHQNSHQPQQNLCMKRIFVLARQGHKHWGFFPLPFLPHFFHLFDLTWAKTRSQAGGYPWLFPRLHVFSHPNPRPTPKPQELCAPKTMKTYENNFDWMWFLDSFGSLIPAAPLSSSFSGLNFW